MKRIEPRLVTLEALHTHTHTHTGSSRGCLECNKIIEKNIKTQNLYSVFVINEDT